MSLYLYHKLNFAIPDITKLSDFLLTWQNIHASEHSNINFVLNSIRKAKNLPLLKIHKLNLFFDPEKLDLINQFIVLNGIEHKEIYKNINDIGSNLTPAFYIKPLYNPITNMIEPLNPHIWSHFLFLEYKIHQLTIRGINLLIEQAQL